MAKVTYNKRMKGLEKYPIEAGKESTDFEEPQTIKDIDKADYRGAVIKYEVTVYDHKEIFTNRMVFNKRLDKEQAIKYAEDFHDIRINDLYEKEMIKDAKPLLRQDIHLFKGKLSRNVSYHEPVKVVRRKIGRKYKYVELPIERKKK